jgi:hypothetical protein
MKKKDEGTKLIFIRLYTNFSVIFNVVLTFSFGFFCISLPLFELANFNINTISLTNYGFAILLGLSSVSFSWSRNIANDDKGKAKRLNDCGVDSLYGAITFLMGSGFKYIAFAANNENLKLIFEFHSSLIFIPKFLALICFIIALVRFHDVITELLKVIDLSQIEDLNNENKENTTLQQENVTKIKTSSNTAESN